MPIRKPTIKLTTNNTTKITTPLRTLRLRFSTASGVWLFSNTNALLKPAHLLWINLITDTFPAIALGVENADEDVMKRNPRNKNEGIFADGLGLNVVCHGIFIAAITLCAFFVGVAMENNGVVSLPISELHSTQGITMAFLTMSMAEIFHAYNARSAHKSIFSLHSHNKIMWAAMIGSLVLTTAVIFIPGVNAAFGFANPDGSACISISEYFIALAMAFAIIPLVEIQKLIVRAVKNKRAKQA